MVFVVNEAVCFACICIDDEVFKPWRGQDTQMKVLLRCPVPLLLNSPALHSYLLSRVIREAVVCHVLLPSFRLALLVRSIHACLRYMPRDKTSMASLSNVSCVMASESSMTCLSKVDRFFHSLCAAQICCSSN